MKTLVDGEEAEEAGGDVARAGGALSLPEEGREVIGAADNSAFPHVEGLSNSLKVQEASCEFKVAVGDGAGRVVVGDELATDFVGPFDAPEDGSVARWESRRKLGGREPDSTSPSFCGIVITVGQGSERNQLLEACGSCRDLREKPPEILERVMGSLTEVEAAGMLGF